MTIATETIEMTKERLAHRRACAYLKGILCGYADSNGHKYYTTKERWPDFDAGFVRGAKVWNTDYITGVHILHNELRGRPEHTSKCVISGIRKELNDYLGDEMAEALEGVSNG